MGILAGKSKHTEENDNNVFWTTMSDLMLGLAIIFMTLFVLAMTGFTQETVELQQNQIKASEQMAERLKEADIDAEVDKLTGNVKISDLQLFDVGSYTLTEKGKRYLDKFVPIYINTIFSNPALYENVVNVVVQGHTDSQMFKGLKSPNEQFVKNMELSLMRAHAVEEYMFKTAYNRQYDATLRKMLTVEGKSFSEPVLTADGKEDLTKSRRVELKLRVKAKNISRMFGLNFGGY